ncbi:MAG: hypothetical protein ACTHZD_15980 [Micrococcaceae bacterium]
MTTTNTVQNDTAEEHNEDTQALELAGIDTLPALTRGTADEDR